MMPLEKDQYEFKFILHELQDCLSNLEMRYYSTPVQRWSLAISVLFIPYQLLQEMFLFLNKSVLWNTTELCNLLDPYDILPEAKNTNNVWTKNIGKYCKKNYAIRIMFLPWLPFFC